MKRFLFFFMVTLLLGLNWSCQKSYIKPTTEAEIDLSVGKRNDLEFQKQLQLVSAYLDSTEYNPELSDSQMVDFYYKVDFFYKHALNLLDSLSKIYPYDSTMQVLQIRANDSYKDYLELMSNVDENNLTTEMVLKELEKLYGKDNGGTIVDSSLMLKDMPPLTIPMADNRKVKSAIKYFTAGKGRGVFKRWLERAGRYETMVKNILREEGAPEELFYLAMIESGLNPKARSYAKAVGMWQFISATGRAYGLKHNWWFDERRDPVKASHAAARHLLDLHKRFGNWHIGIAAYNFSPGKIQRRINRYNVKEFWDLPRLPRQTRAYVPTYLAAVSIARNQEKYNFQVTPYEPLQFDTVTVRECVDLNIVAKCVRSTFNELKTLNPSLLRWCTPPNMSRWLLNLPPGSRSMFLAKYPEIPKEKKFNWARHRVRRGETLSTIARGYRVAVREIKQFNKIRGNLIRAGRTLIIPVPQNKKYYKKYVASQKRPKKSYRRKKPVTRVKGRKKFVHTVKKGESLWELAINYKVSLTSLRKWNRLGRTRIIKPGQKLNVWLKPGNKAFKKSSKSSKLARKKSQPKQLSSNKSPGNFIYYKVRPGDNLWDIAQAHGVSIRSIKKWNKKRSNKIRPGEKLKIYQKQR